MGKYIELDVAKKAFQNMDAGRVGDSTLLSPKEFSEYLDEIPTADVAPVRRGKWGCYRPICGGYPCSSCKLTHRNCTAYCPNCGAKMETKL